MPDTPPVKRSPPNQLDKKARLAAALRENLKRRKAQARAQATVHTDLPGGTSGDNGEK